MSQPSRPADADSLETDTRDRRGDKPGDEYVSPAEVRTLLARSLTARQQRASAIDMISAFEAARLMGTKRAIIEAWIAEGRALGVVGKRGRVKLPKWQFEAPLWDVLPQLLDLLSSTEGWRLLLFLDSPNGALGGITPRQAIERGMTEKVIEVAMHGDD